MKTTAGNKFSKEDFYRFCKMAEEATDREFEIDRVTEISSDYLSYCAYFNDQDNYNIPFQISLEGGMIKWESPVFLKDEIDSVKPYFEDVIEETYESFLDKIESER